MPNRPLNDDASRDDTTRDDTTRNDDVRYERRDVRLRPLLACAVGLAGLLVVVGVAMAGLFRVFADETQRAPIAVDAPATLDSARQLQQLREQEESLLNDYAWVDKRKNIVRIPITRAMELMAESSTVLEQEDAESAEESMGPK